MTNQKKAKIAWEDGREVVVTQKVGNMGPYNYKGFIVGYNTSEIILRHQLPSKMVEEPMTYDYIADICFVDEEELEPEDDDSADRLSQKLEHAKKYGYAVEVTYRDSPGIAGACGVVLDVDIANACINLDHRAIQIDSIQHVEIAYTQAESAPDEPHDIAKERWRALDMSDGSRILCIPDNGEFDGKSIAQIDKCANDVQIAVMEAAAELADMIREEVARDAWDELDMPFMNKRIKFLRKLGIPNVAPWYKEEA